MIISYASKVDVEDVEVELEVDLEDESLLEVDVNEDNWLEEV